MARTRREGTERRGLERALWVGLLAAACALLLAVPALLDLLAPAPPAAPPPAPPAPAAAAARPTPPRPGPRAAPALPLPAPEEAPMPSDTPGGLAAFNPPGTKPIKRGLVVPEGFALPPGFVRHYQTLDDGRQLPAVLMFHPDAHPTDAQGRPVPLPADGLVPPELAPPGMPLQTLEVPEALAEGSTDENRDEVERERERHR